MDIVDLLLPGRSSNFTNPAHRILTRIPLSDVGNDRIFARWDRWPDPPRAIQAAREALNLAADPACRYAWGIADAAQAWAKPT